MADDIEIIYDDTDEDELVAEELAVAAEEGEEVPFTYAEDAPNLVHEFVRHPEGKEALKKLTEKLTKDFDDAWKSAEEYREQRAKEWSFFAGVLKKKDFPFKGCANGNVPIMLENITRLHARAYGELFGDWQSVMGVVPVGPDDEIIAAALSQHGNWQIREQIPNFKREQSRGVLAFFAHGDITFHSYYNEQTELNEHELLGPDEFCIPYARVTTKPDYADIPYLCKRLRWYRHELEARRETWYGVDEVIKRASPKWQTDEGEPNADVVADITGLHAPDDAPDNKDLNAPYNLIHYEGWAELPQQSKARYIQAIFEKDTQSILFLTIHEEANWQDLQRWERETQELEQFRAQQQARLLMMQAAAEMEQANQLAVVEHEQVVQEHTEDAAAQVALGLASPDMASMALDQIEATPPVQEPVPEVPPEPMPPAWMADPNDPEEKPRPPRMEPIRLFAHGVCIESLSGNLGLSYGRVQAAFNEAANVALNQFIDAATLGNVGMYVTAPGVDFDAPFEVKPGKQVRIKNMPHTDIRQSMMPFEFQPGNPQLVQLVDKLYQYGQSSMQAPSVLSGDPGKSGETYRGIAARIEQATKQLATSTRQYASVLEQVLKNNAKLNAKFLKEEEFFYISNYVTESSATQEKVRREWYARDYRVTLKSDLRFATMAQKIQEADDAFQKVAMDPFLQSNLAIQYAVRRKALEARGRHDLVALMGQPPPPPQVFGMPPMPPPGAPAPGADPNAPPPPQGAQ